MTKRIAISLPDHLFRSLERVRRQRRAARSAVIQDAVGEYVERNDKKALEETYFESYRQEPDEGPELTALTKVAIASLKKARLP